MAYPPFRGAPRSPRSSFELSQPSDIARHHVDFQIDLRAGQKVLESGHLECMRDQVDGKARTRNFVDGQADAVHRDGPLLSDKSRQLSRGLDGKIRTSVRIVDDSAKFQYRAHAIHVTCNQMAAQPVRETQGFFQIDARSGTDGSRAAERLRGNVELQSRSDPSRDGQTTAVDCNAIAYRDVGAVEIAGR